MPLKFKRHESLRLKHKTVGDLTRTRDPEPTLRKTKKQNMTPHYRSLLVSGTPIIVRVRKYTENVAQQMLLDLFPSKLVFPPHIYMRQCAQPDYRRIHQLCSADMIVWGPTAIRQEKKTFEERHACSVPRGSALNYFGTINIIYRSIV